MFVVSVLFGMLTGSGAIDDSGEAAVHSRILGGQKNTIESYPFMVQVEVHTWPAGKSCGGTLIDPSYVLTAATCLYHDGVVYPTETIEIRYGSSVLRMGGETEWVVRAHFHPLFEFDRNRTSPWNAVVLELESGIEPSDSVQVVRLDDGDRLRETAERDGICTVVGWGSGRKGSAIRTQHLLRSTTNYLLDDDACRETTGSEREEVCTYSPAAEYTCSEDLGGPLLCDGVQCAVISHQLGCGHHQRPTLHVRISAIYHDFLLPFIKDAVDRLPKKD